jgi:NADP-dependent 3-hydroxy acid dehydrogenase YdfG
LDASIRPDGPPARRCSPGHAADIAEVIAFAVTRPRSVSLNEILVRPTAQAL